MERKEYNLWSAFWFYITRVILINMPQLIGASPYMDMQLSWFMNPHSVISCQVMSIQLCYSIVSFVLYWPPIGVLDCQLRYRNVKLCNFWCIIHTFLLHFNKSLSTFHDKKKNITFSILLTCKWTSFRIFPQLHSEFSLKYWWPGITPLSIQILPFKKAKKNSPLGTSKFS